MAIVKINGRPVVVGTLSIPRAGVWHGDFEVDGDTALPASVTIVDDDITYVASVYRQGALVDSTYVWLRGGAGGMNKVLPARSYVDMDLSSVLGEILTGAGEKLSPTSDANVLSQRLPHWTRDEGEAGSAITLLAKAAGAIWRVLRDGTVWIGIETYPTQSLTGFQRLDPDPILATYVIAPDKIDLSVGVTFDGNKVSRVEHQIHDAKLRTIYWAEDGANGATSTSALDRIKEAVAGIVRRIMRETKYYKLYPSTVQGQDASGLLSLYPDDSSIRGTGTDKVPIRYALTGASQKVSVGARALLGFENGNPQAPYAILTGEGTATDTTLPTGTLPLVRTGDMTASSISAANLAQVAALLVCGGPGSPATVNPAALATLQATPIIVYGTTVTGNNQLKG